MAATRLALAGFERSHALHVSGTIQEVPLQEAVTQLGISYTALDLWTGSLAGTGVVHFFSTQAVGDAVIATAKNALFTPDGDLVFSVVGTQTGTTVKGVLTVEGGTGIYKNARGQINLQGTIGANGVTFTYSGTITRAE